MIKLLSILCFLTFNIVAAQKFISQDSLKISEAREVYRDDYGSIYIYKDQDFSLTKYDSLGKQTGKMMLTFPFKIQSVNNPLNMILFSENTQELKILDQNLNEIQKIQLPPYLGYIKAAYAEDLQYIWILDDSRKTISQYNYRNQNTINSYPINIDTDLLVDFLMYENKIFILSQNKLEIYNTKGNRLFTQPLENAKRLRRNNDEILIFEKNKILSYSNNNLTLIFEKKSARIVDKNQDGYLAVIGNKLYLYTH